MRASTERPRRIAVLLCGVASSLLSCASPADRPADPAPIQALMRTTAEMNNAGDVEGWVALFDEGAVYMPPGMPPVTTREGLRDVARAGFTSWRSEIEIVPEEIVVLGAWAFARDRVTGTATPRAGGESVSIDMKQIVIYRRQPDGRWMIARLIGNSNS